MTFLRRYSAIQTSLLGLGALLLLPVLFMYPARADGASGISQSFQTSETNAIPGAIMSLKPGSPSTVELANDTRAEQLVGIMALRPLIELNSDKQIQVVTGGVTNALVSDISGEVKSGDKITASPVDGVGMKAVRSAPTVGTAQADLKKVKTTERFITDQDGKIHVVHVGMIPIQVNVSFYAAPEDRMSFLPPFLQNFANALSGRQVSPVRVMVSTVALVLAFVSIAVLLYASIKSSIISIGRNPLSEAAVRKSLLEVALTIVGILLLTVIAIYLILTT